MPTVVEQRPLRVSYAGRIDAAGNHWSIGTCPCLFTGSTTNRTHAIHAPVELRAHASSSPVAYPVSASPPLVIFSCWVLGSPGPGGNSEARSTITGRGGSTTRPLPPHCACTPLRTPAPPPRSGPVLGAVVVRNGSFATQTSPN